MQLRLCDNCLEPGAQPLRIGDGDPAPEVDLCSTCRRSLLEGDFETLANDEVDERLLKRRDIS